MAPSKGTGQVYSRIITERVNGNVRGILIQVIQ